MEKDKDKSKGTVGQRLGQMCYVQERTPCARRRRWNNVVMNVVPSARTQVGVEERYFQDLEASKTCRIQAEPEQELMKSKRACGAQTFDCMHRKDPAGRASRTKTFLFKFSTKSNTVGQLIRQVTIKQIVFSWGEVRVQGKSFSPRLIPITGTIVERETMCLLPFLMFPCPFHLLCYLSSA